jgi:Spy/CpxP family protein refolding chaperone
MLAGDSACSSDLTGAEALDAARTALPSFCHSAADVLPSTSRLLDQEAEVTMTKTWQRVAGTALGVALLAGAGLTTVTALEQGPGGPGGFIGRRGPGGPGGGRGAGLPLRELGLTDTQREQVRTAMGAHKGEFDAIATRLRTARTALQDAVTAATFDEGAVRAKAADLAAVEADAAVLRAKAHAEVWALLTPEQQQKAQQLKAQRAERQAQMRERFQQRRQQRQQQRQQQPRG